MWRDYSQHEKGCSQKVVETIVQRVRETKVKQQEREGGKDCSQCGEITVSMGKDVVRR